MTEQQASNLKSFFESMDQNQVQQFSEQVGFKPDVNGKTQPDDVITPRVPPLLIPVLAFIGGAAAGKLLDEAMNYGIAKTCQMNEGKWAILDDVCETNGHI